MVSITGHQHTSEAQWLQCNPNEQPTHPQLSVYHPESTIGSISVVLGVSLTSAGYFITCNDISISKMHSVEPGAFLFLNALYFSLQNGFKIQAQPTACAKENIISKCQNINRFCSLYLHETNQQYIYYCLATFSHILTLSSIQNQRKSLINHFFKQFN